MSVYLPLMMQSLFNTPIALSDAKAKVIVSAFAGRLNIQSLEAEAFKLDRAGMRDLAASGRKEADLDRNRNAAARRVQAPEGPMTSDDWYGDRPYKLTSKGIAIIEISGTLTRTWGVGPYSGTTGYDGIWTQLAFAMDDDSCTGIWLKINSGGGAIDGLADLAQGIYRCSARFGGKPIWAFAGDAAYSAAYWLASAADRVIVAPLGGVGSIGVIAIYADITRALEEEGIEAIIFRSAKRKAIGIGGIEKMDDQEINHIQSQIDEAGGFFEAAVAQYRSIAKSAVSETQGTDYTASQALAIGLVDDVLTEQDAWNSFERELAQ